MESPDSESEELRGQIAELQEKLQKKHRSQKHQR